MSEMLGRCSEGGLLSVKLTPWDSASSKSRGRRTSSRLKSTISSVNPSEDSGVGMAMAMVATKAGMTDWRRILRRRLTQATKLRMFQLSKDMT